MRVMVEIADVVDLSFCCDRCVQSGTILMMGIRIKKRIEYIFDSNLHNSFCD